MKILGKQPGNEPVVFEKETYNLIEIGNYGKLLEKVPQAVKYRPSPSIRKLLDILSGFLIPKFIECRTTADALVSRSLQNPKL